MVNSQQSYEHFENEENYPDRENLVRRNRHPGPPRGNRGSQENYYRDLTGGIVHQYEGGYPEERYGGERQTDYPRGTYRGHQRADNEATEQHEQRSHAYHSGRYGGDEDRYRASTGYRRPSRPRYGYGANFERDYIDQPGPHSGKGPKGYKRSNDQIREEVCRRLERDGMVDASDIEVEIDRRNVAYLKGKVEDRETKRRAEDLSEDVYGVEDVVNELRINRGILGSILDTFSSDSSS